MIFLGCGNRANALRTSLWFVANHSVMIVIFFCAKRIRHVMNILINIVFAEMFADACATQLCFEQFHVEFRHVHWKVGPKK